MKRVVIFAAVFVALAALVAGTAYFHFVAKPAMIRGFITAAVPPPTTVIAEAARVEVWAPEIPAIGTFGAVRGVDIAPQVGSVVKALHFDSGQEIRAGALLVQLDDAVEQADLAANAATLRNAEYDLERQRELFGRGNAPKSAYDAALARRDSAAAAVQRTRALIAQKAILAPFAGRLGIRKVDIGQYVSPGTPLVTLQQLDPINVDFPLAERHIATIAVGQGVELQVDAYPGGVFKGTLRSIDARVSAETRNILVRAEVENADKRLLPGMFANVAVRAGEPRRLVTLPRTAVTYSLFGDSVYVAMPGNADPRDLVAEQRFLRVGEAREDRVAVLQGVEEGEMVVTAGQLKLQNGARIRIAADEKLEPGPERPKQ
jgi:RND family efflux transporter MFP subunit